LKNHQSRENESPKPQFLKTNDLSLDLLN